MQNDGSITERTVINIHAVHDDNGDVVTEDVITSISLTSPEGELVELGPIKFEAKPNVITFKYLNAGWEGNAEPYYGYGTTLVNHSPPHGGVYSALITFIDSSHVHIGFGSSSGKINLPFVDLNEVRKNKTRDGFYIYWKNPPVDIKKNDIRVWLKVYDSAGELLGELYYKRAIYAEYIWAPTSYIDAFGSDIGNITINFQVRTSDAMDRTYTKDIDIKNIPPIVRKTVPAIRFLLLN